LPNVIVYDREETCGSHASFHSFLSIMGTAKNPDETGHAFHLAEAAKARGIVTIGVGDGSNEIGNGLIYDAARQIQPYGLKCQCDCYTFPLAWRRQCRTHQAATGVDKVTEGDKNGTHHRYGM
jgi:hypothetical protein